MVALWAGQAASPESGFEWRQFCGRLSGAGSGGRRRNQQEEKEQQQAMPLVRAKGWTQIGGLFPFENSNNQPNVS